MDKLEVKQLRKKLEGFWSQYDSLASLLDRHRKEYLTIKEIYDSDPDMVCPALAIQNNVITRVKTELIELKKEIDLLEDRLRTRKKPLFSFYVTKTLKKVGMLSD
ncbi:hypothetical protein D3C71_1390770 [compost metagenome]